ncbi:MAG: DUF190 domain-containing protein [Gemmataceae bacterium]
MNALQDALQASLFLNSTDQYHGRPMYSAIIHLCQEKGLAGASVVRCMEGYGAGHHLHTQRILELSNNMPIRIDIIDTPDRIHAFLESASGILSSGMAVLTPVKIMRFEPAPKTG